LLDFSQKTFSPITGVSLAAATVGVAMTAAAFAAADVLYFKAKQWGWLVFDPADMMVYFESARWIIEGGRLYREVPSDYPLFANIIFAVARYLNNMLHAGSPGLYTGLRGFYCLWIASTSMVYLCAVYRIATGTTILAALAWLAPASIFFAVFRFDIYPVAATLLSLFAIQRTRYIEGAIWLGVAAALKGYALWLLPAYCVFIVYQRGVAAAIKVGVLAVAPMLLSLLATLIFTGWEGMIAPFSSQALRTLNGESTFDAFNYLFGVRMIPDGPTVRWVGQSLQVACAIAAAAMRPRNFDDLINAFLFAVLGFMSFSVFYSPQYVLWILPLVSFSRSRIMLISAISLSWLTYLYNPIGFWLYWADNPPPHDPPGLFKAAVAAVSVCRLFMLFLTVTGHFKRLPWRGHPQGGPAQTSWSSPAPSQQPQAEIAARAVQ